MKWVAISGSWQKINKKVEEDVRQEIKEILNRGNGIVSGGALNVDYLATNEALKFDPTGSRVKVFIPATLDIYAAHYRKRAEQGIITKQQAEDLITQLKNLKELEAALLVENLDNEVVNGKAYFERNSAVVEAADELVAFHVNESKGVINTIEKAKRKGIAIRIFTYTI